MREKVQGNIANALFRRFILTGLILILISTAASVVLEYFRQRGAMRETAERIQEVDIVPIQEALWVADFYMLNTLLEALTRDRFVATAEVIEDGAILASAGTEARGPVRPHTYIMSYEYEGAPRYLGRLRLELNLAPVWSNALALGLAGSLYPTVAILVVGVVLFLGFHRSVVNPLMQIADYLRDFSVDYEPRPLELSPRGGHDDGDELTAIAAAVNALRDSLNHRYQQLLNANKRTEARVIEKTHELQLTNAALEREVGELERTKDELSEANRAKTLFLANISHEIRTPITGVVGLAKLLKNTRLDDQQQEYTSAIVDSASSLLEIIEDLLDFSKLESSTAELQQEPFDPHKSVMMVVGLLGSTVEGQSAEVHVDIDPDVPQRCIGDGGRVQQVLRNLLSNAVKFTPDGEIRISLSQTGKENGQARLCFSVADTGVGIAEEEIGRLFESFYQVDSSYSKDFKGAGLGLSICKHLVELMNGEIGVQSVPGEGSTFWFEIPCGIDPEHAAPPSADQAADQPLGARQQVDSSASPGAGDVSDTHVLIAEDNAINRFYLEQLVKGFGCSVTAVPDGESVVRALEHASYDIILMDIQMPGMDGIETTREVRKRSDVPVVALTAYARESEIQSFLNAGMNAAVTKPVNEDELLRVILEQVGAGAR